MDILASLSSGAVGGLLGGIGTLAKDIRSAITGEISPEKKAEIEAKILEIEGAAAQGQMAINLQEAKAESVFVSGWRPFIGWTCGIALFYNYIFMPLLVWVTMNFNPNAPAMPILETSELYTLLGGMLGLGWLRSQDKKLDPSPKGKE
jgi:hypothetical protein